MVDTLAHFVRERIPERWVAYFVVIMAGGLIVSVSSSVVHAKGGTYPQNFFVELRLIPYSWCTWLL